MSRSKINQCANDNSLSLSLRLNRFYQIAAFTSKTKLNIFLTKKFDYIEKLSIIRLYAVSLLPEMHKSDWCKSTLSK